ncbi:xanthine dehydrogenase family protein subunit M [Borrelia miyamotoi]|uniref:Xanthine dehydrogenase family protein subunit M n=1 Tax=Borrelia miyamotoi TaxID=47466 RepID=A0AAX3JMG7_9SPIR|nr:xanthine dehydrogenase family protein subunit M [Borrelia miyamotoi]QFP41797.1 xanthine dehydrogenase family protein subunit M [Borrelia miyamotoi]QFP47917.1 xanthine dehydrogenase family protein subunit M [Borrelia miyamotoi]QGT55677.1 xanthine dehydrogenase family protein subunit M [Borrelia miyamotoi]QGT56460.1 xanthine dehydrogenase family protein subunit M [Borrelia miyamotoi]WAZ71706.1 xanthine dehydrogenase family protein subunit M [Borrelia miyamotoi]
MSCVRVYYPENFNALVSLFKSDLENYIVYNEIDFHKNSEVFMKKEISGDFFVINNFEKFNKVSLKSNFLEMGPCITYDAILQFGERNIPRLFYEFISRLSDRIYLSSINIANGFYYKNTVFDLYPLLLSLDAHLEFKSILTKKTYTYNAYNINRDDYIQSRNTLFLSKLKFPITNVWNKSFYSRIFVDSFSFDVLEEVDIIFVCVLLNVKRDIISDFLMKIFYNDKVITLRDFQVLLINKSLPLSVFEIEDSIKMLDKNIRDAKIFSLGERSLRLIKNFYFDMLSNF